ncbi:MAG: hypothetical protein HFG75_16940 [Hungatella sp.]|nr:hypothetical protein [Hungatella sp.]
MEFSRDDLAEAKRQIDSTLHKLRKRRIRAFEIANYFIDLDLLSVARACSGCREAI